MVLDRSLAAKLVKQAAVDADEAVVVKRAAHQQAIRKQRNSADRAYSLSKREQRLEDREVAFRIKALKVSAALKTVADRTEALELREKRLKDRETTLLRSAREIEKKARPFVI